METAKKLGLSPGNVGCADTFIEEMKEKTGCSVSFIEEARASIVKLFADVKGGDLEECLDQIRHLIRQQAETEKRCSYAKEAVLELEKSQRMLDVHLVNAKRQLEDIREALRGAASDVYGSMALSKKIIRKA